MVAEEETTPTTVDVLIVDDEEDIRAVLAMCFRKAGLTVAEAANGREAFLAVCRGPVRSVVLDVMMPDIDGFQVLDALRSQAESWDIRVAVLTCASSAKTAETAWTLGADDFLTKPIDPDAVLTSILRLLAASRAAISDRRHDALERLEHNA